MTLAGIALVQAIIYLLFIRAIDLYEREPLRYIIPVFVWGFTVAVVISIFFEAIFAVAVSVVVGAEGVDFLTTVVAAPVIEECAKGLALLIVFAVSYLFARRRGRLQFSGVMDGIVYGSAVGFGFSLAEDYLYLLQFGEEVFVIRRLFGGFAHAAFTSLIGIGFGLVPWVRPLSLKLALPLAGLAGAVALHAAFNFTAFFFGPLAYVLQAVVILLYVVLITVWLAVERRTIREELREEVDLGTITAAEYGILPTYFRRTLYYLRLILTGELGTWSRARRVHGAAVDLAFTKRLSRSSRAAPGESSVRHLRQRIGELRGEAV
ncbi:PrsW family intramembrane metalloprotease [Rubrobacter taiwanensis]|uniref:PrsW family intramembrane metalloprotease n=1 Tax=Rubrobacter taiwanensis TaxID=185139 RepID=A0A4R1BHL7_9ACTN|nr:PrsW family intramembrane metalloprotease [Rubrobacter taiwanensis]TCJ16785.1 PrsW family intramembrane metalloprotease [Rubrobacter taiwanensis]